MKKAILTRLRNSFVMLHNNSDGGRRFRGLDKPHIHF